MRVGQKVMVLPSGYVSTVKEIWTLDGTRDEAFCPQSVTFRLEDDIDVSRGDMIVDPDNLPGSPAPSCTRAFCWLHPKPLQPGRKYFLKHTTQTVPAAGDRPSNYRHRHFHARTGTRCGRTGDERRGGHPAAHRQTARFTMATR